MGTDGAQSREPRQHFVTIQILRGLAATAVALFHSSQMVGHPIHVAAFGVDIFFVISGFLMVSITNEETRPWPFLKDRILRIVPLYWLATAALLAWLLRFAPSALPRPDQLLASLFFIPYRPSADGPIFPVLALGWTLNYEMMFYLIFAGTLVLSVQRRLPALTAGLTALIAFGSIFRPAAASLEFWTNPVIVQFLAGAWLAVWWKGGRRRSVPIAAALIGGGALALYLLFLAAHYLYIANLGVDRSPLAIPAVLIVAGALHLEPPRGSWPTRMLTALGNASYSIYIWQVSAILAAGLVVSKAGMGTAASFTTFMLFCVGGGLVSYHLVEKPLMALLRRPRSIRGIRVPAGP